MSNRLCFEEADLYYVQVPNDCSYINFDNMSRGGGISGSCGEDGLCDMSRTGNYYHPTQYSNLSSRKCNINDDCGSSGRQN